VAAKIRDLAAAEKVAERQGGVTAYQQEQLGKQLLELSQQGAKIPASLSPVVERAAALSLQSKVAGDGVAYLNKQLKDFPTYGLQALPTFDGLINRSDSLNKYLRDNLGPAIKTLPAPPPDPWQIWHDGITNMLSGPGGLVENMGMTIGSLTHGWDDFWGNLKQTASNVLDDMVSMLIHQFLDPALEAILGRQSAFGKAISGLFGGVASGAGQAAGAAGAAGTVGTAGTTGAGVGAGLLAAAESAGVGAAAAGAGYLLAKMGSMLVEGIAGTGLLGTGSYAENTIYDIDPTDQYAYQRQGLSQAEIDNLIANGVPAMADGGVVSARPGGGLFRLGEGRFDEMVTPLDPRDLRDDDDRPIRIYLDGREVGRNQVRHIPSLLFGAGY
jgi:hypothetical protein